MCIKYKNLLDINAKATVDGDMILIPSQAFEKLQILVGEIRNLNQQIASMKTELKRQKRIIGNMKKTIKWNKNDINRIGSYLEAYRRIVQVKCPGLYLDAETYCKLDQTLGRHKNKSANQYING